MSRGIWIAIVLMAAGAVFNMVSNLPSNKDQSKENLVKYLELKQNKFTSTFLDKTILELLHKDSLNYDELSQLKRLESRLNEERINVKILQDQKLIYWHGQRNEKSYCQDPFESGGLSIDLCVSLFDHKNELHDDLYSKANIKHFVYRNLTTEGHSIGQGQSIIIGDRHRSSFSTYIVLALFLLGFLILVFSGLRHDNYFGLIGLVILRSLMTLTNWKEGFSHTHLVSDIFNGVSYSSLELLIDTFLLFGVLIAFANYQFSKNKKAFNYLFFLVNFIFLALLFVSHIKLIQLLMFSDKLSISVNNIQAIRLEDVSVFLSVLLLKAGIFIFATSFILNMKQVLKRKELYFGFFICVILAVVLSKIFLLELNPWLLGLFLGAYFILVDLFIDIKNKTITWIIWWGIFFGAYLSALFFNYDIKKEIDARQEFLKESFYPIPKIQKTNIVATGILDSVSQEIEQLLILPEEARYDTRDIHTFISKKFDREDILIRVFNAEGESLLAEDSYVYPFLEIGESEYFDELKNELWFEKYLANEYSIWIGFQLGRYNHKNIYPYNYVSQGNVYKNKLGINNLQLKSVLESAQNILYEGSTVFIKQEVKPGHFLIAQKSFSGLIKPVALFAFFFSSIVLLILVLSLINSFINFLPSDWPFKIDNINSLNSKIQISLILVILFSFFIIAFITSSFLKSFINSKNETFINEKLEAISRDLQDKTSIAESETEVVGIASNYETKLENIHGADLTIILLDEEEADREYFPYAYFSKQTQPASYTDNSKKHKLVNYLPLYYKSKVVGYNKVEYNASILQRISVVDFLGSIFNVYVFLFLIASVIAIFIARSISKPIALLNQKLSQVKLGKENELIKWDKEDEIGMLINNYNKMVEQLEESAQLLAKTERDSAWREMAKQVAHEIKNPLTPMKMYIQHLEKAIKQQPENAVEISKKISATLLEQIENLTEIASSFGNVAELPQSSNVKIELNKVVQLVHNLFRKREDMDIQLSEPIDPIYVYADKNQLIRILNNLVKNAIEAIPAEREGKIQLKLYSQDGKALIKVSDNGTGIKENMLEKVFQPKFTTKDSGSGLGLAIASNMMESMNGRLYCNSNYGQGSDFYIELDLIRQTTLKDNTRRILLD